MALHGDEHAKFIDPDQSTLQFINGNESNEDSSYVVMAHIYGIISRTAFGLDLAVTDHTDKAVLSVRGDAAFEFYANHLYHYPDHEEIVDLYALDNEWEQTYLFKICTSRVTQVLGHTSYIVNNMCMVNLIINQFAAIKMNQEERNSYNHAIQNVARRVFPDTIGLLSTSAYDDIHPNIALGFKRRIYAPFQI